MPKKNDEKKEVEEPEKVESEEFEKLIKPVDEEIEPHETEPAWVKSIRDLLTGVDARLTHLETRILQTKETQPEKVEESKDHAQDLQERQDHPGGGAEKVTGGDGDDKKHKPRKIRLWRTLG